jgi:hypothetical protein
LQYAISHQYLISIPASTLVGPVLASREDIMMEILRAWVQAYRDRMAHLKEEIAKLEELERAWRGHGLWHR